MFCRKRLAITSLSGSATIVTTNERSVKERDPLLLAGMNIVAGHRAIAYLREPKAKRA